MKRSLFGGLSGASTGSRKRRKASNRGAALVEYSILVGLISIVAISSVRDTGEEIACLFERSANALAGAGFAADCGGLGGAGGETADGSENSGDGEDSTPYREIQIAAASLPEAMVGQDYDYDFSALLQTPDADPTWSYDISYGQLPPGLSLDANSGLLSGSPANDSEGDHAFRVVATDPQGDGKREFTLYVSEAIGKMSSISSIHGTTCGFLLDGETACWGTNADGHFGMTNEEKSGSDVPWRNPVLSKDYAQIELAKWHACALTTSGAVDCWGTNQNGVLGTGDFDDRVAPTRVVGLPAGIRQIAISYSTSCAIDGTGQVWCWGAGSYGQLGDAGATSRSNVPVAVAGATDAVQIAMGIETGCLLNKSGGVECWGTSSKGTRGDGVFDNSPKAMRDVVGLSAGVTAIKMDELNACAQMSNGLLKCWGFNFYGAVGDGTKTDRAVPVDVVNLGVVKSFDVGNSSVCAVEVSDAVLCWGIGGPALGNSDFMTTQEDSTSPTPVDNLPAGSGVEEIYVSGHTTFARRDDNGILSWGNNDHGNMAIGDTTVRNAYTHWKTEPVQN